MGGWRDLYNVHNRDEFFHAYDQTGQLCMMYQKAVNFKEYFRCYVGGQKKVYIMPYEPRNAHHERYPQNPRGNRRALSRCRHHSPGSRQLKHPHAQSVGGSLWRSGEWVVMGTFHRSLHAQARKLAESGRDRDQSLPPPMPGNTPNWEHRCTPPPDQSMEPPRQSRQNQNPMEVYPKTSSSHAPLLFHAVTVLVLMPGSTDAHYYLGKALVLTGHVADGLGHWKQALQSQPDSLQVLNDMAWVLATSRDDGVRNGEQALSLAQHAAQLTSEQEPAILGTLSAVYAEMGQFNKAIELGQRAADLARPQNKLALAQNLTEQLALFRSNRPIRQ
jgi:tetratricopeptide (TPR) repeat protein